MVDLIARIGLGFGIFLILSAGLLLLYLPAGSAEAVVSLLTLGLGALLSLTSAIALYTERKRR
jgi:hypothetical protein